MPRCHAEEADRLHQAFQDKYITKAGLVVGDSQTALALALLFKLHTDPAQTRAASDRLARLVRYSKFQCPQDLLVLLPSFLP